MRKRHPNYRLVKIHRNYSVEEVANLFGFHKQTVRNWVKDGLATIDSQRPWLILGSVLAAYLKDKRTKNRRRCKPGELFCVKCREPKFPAGGIAEYSPYTDKVGNLKGICPACNSIMNRRVSISKLSQVRGKIEVIFSVALRQLDESAKRTVNIDLKEE